MKKLNLKQRKSKPDDFEQAELLAIRALAQNEGWIALQKDVKRQIKFLEWQILNDDSLSETVEISQRDIVRMRRDMARRFIKRPEQLTNFEGEDGVVGPEINLDPYPRNITETRKVMERGRGNL